MISIMCCLLHVYRKYNNFEIVLQITHKTDPELPGENPEWLNRPELVFKDYFRKFKEKMINVVIQ